MNIFYYLLKDNKIWNLKLVIDYICKAGKDIKLCIIKKINKDYTIEFENTTDTYLPIIDTKVMYNLTTQIKWKYLFIENTLTEVFGVECSDKFIWEELLGRLHNCNCMHCIRNKIRLLELVLTFPVSIELDAIINIHIMQQMLPSLKIQLVERMHRIMFMIQMELSFDQGGNKRHSASESEVDLVSNIIKECPEDRKKEKCIFCLEKFSEMEQPAPLVIECRGCNNIFCAKK